MKRFKMPKRGLSDAERRVLEELNSGRMVSGARLAKVAGFTGKNATRALRKHVIWRLRSQFRIPILGWPGRGYQLPQTPEDARGYMHLAQQYGRDWFAIGSIIQGVTVDVVAGQALLGMFEPEGPAASPHEKAFELFLQTGKRRTRIADVLGQTVRLLKKHPDLFKANAELLKDEYGVLVLSAEQADKLRRASRDLDEVLAAGATA